MKFRSLFIVMVAIFVSPAWSLGGMDKNHVMDEDLCSVGGQTIALRLISPSGEAPENDMSLHVVQGKTDVVVDKKADWLAFLSPQAKMASVCKSGTAVELPGRRLLFVLWSDGRPENQYLNAGVYDALTGQVLDWRKIGELYSEDAISAQFAAIPNGISVRAISDRPNDGPEGLVETWLNVTFDGRNVVTQWDPSRPPVHH